MTDDELRALIRSAIQKHMGGEATAPTPISSPAIRLKPDAPLNVSLSFGQYRLERGVGETECLIEPSVQCNHCGFCKCHGH
jgi:hypothetical protein